MESAPDSKEHIIPACVGGTLEARILCTQCNSQFGADLVSQIKQDPTFKVAFAHLRNRIPQLAAKFEEGLDFIAQRPDGAIVVVSQKKGIWKTKAKGIPANRLVMDTTEAEAYVRNSLKKQAMPGDEIKRWVRRFWDCGYGKELRLPNGDVVVKSEAGDPVPRLAGSRVDDRVPVLIAFEFLALALGESISSNRFDPIRGYLRNGLKTDRVQVTVKRTRGQFLPLHKVRFQKQEQALTVFVQFFDWYVFDVMFCDIPLPSEEVVYLEDLESKQSLIAISPYDARRGNWTVLYPE
jgi:hypothetical protein